MGTPTPRSARFSTRRSRLASAALPTKQLLSSRSSLRIRVPLWLRRHFRHQPECLTASVDGSLSFWNPPLPTPRNMTQLYTLSTVLAVGSLSEVISALQARRVDLLFNSYSSLLWNWSCWSHAGHMLHARNN